MNLIVAFRHNTASTFHLFLERNSSIIEQKVFIILQLGIYILSRGFSNRLLVAKLVGIKYGISTALMANTGGNSRE